MKNNAIVLIPPFLHKKHFFIQEKLLCRRLVFEKTSSSPTIGVFKYILLFIFVITVFLRKVQFSNRILIPLEAPIHSSIHVYYLTFPQKALLLLQVLVYLIKDPVKMLEVLSLYPDPEQLVMLPLGCERDE